MELTKVVVESIDLTLSTWVTLPGLDRKKPLFT